jgi:hypothetical protein
MVSGSFEATDHVLHCVLAIAVLRKRRMSMLIHGHHCITEAQAPLDDCN